MSRKSMVVLVSLFSLSIAQRVLADSVTAIVADYNRWVWVATEEGHIYGYFNGQYAQELPTPDEEPRQTIAQMSISAAKNGADECLFIAYQHPPKPIYMLCRYSGTWSNKWYKVDGLPNSLSAQ